MVLKTDYDVSVAKDAEEAFQRIGKNPPDVVLLDIILPDMDGLKVLERIKQKDPDAIVIMITATKTVKTAVEAMKLGAYDYITKPFDVDELRLIVNRAISTQALKNEVDYLREEIEKTCGFGNIIAESKLMHDVFGVVKQIADSRSTVLILGESGTGKELVSRATATRPLAHGRGSWPAALARAAGCRRSTSASRAYVREVVILDAARRPQLGSAAEVMWLLGALGERGGGDHEAQLPAGQP